MSTIFAQKGSTGVVDPYREGLMYRNNAVPLFAGQQTEVDEVDDVHFIHWDVVISDQSRTRKQSFKIDAWVPYDSMSEEIQYTVSNQMGSTNLQYNIDIVQNQSRVTLLITNLETTGQLQADTIRYHIIDTFQSPISPLIPEEPVLPPVTGGAYTDDFETYTVGGGFPQGGV